PSAVSPPPPVRDGLVVAATLTGPLPAARGVTPRPGRAWPAGGPSPRRAGGGGRGRPRPARRPRRRARRTGARPVGETSPRYGPRTPPSRCRRGRAAAPGTAPAPRGRGARAPGRGR